MRAFRVLVTRPREDAGPLAEALSALGVEAVLEPLLEICFLDVAAPVLDDVQAVLVTSANGARALAATEPRRDLPVYAVGDASARAAVAAGFAKVESAAGDVADLARLVARRLDPTRGAVLHVAGSRVAGDLAGALEAAGFTCRRAVLYEARKAEGLSAGTVEAIGEGAIDGVALFSPRTAEHFVELARKAGLAQASRTMIAFCLSEAVAGKARALPWREVCVAPRPNQAALLETIRARLHAEK